jgi:hypothetical protein
LTSVLGWMFFVHWHVDYGYKHLTSVLGWMFFVHWHVDYGYKHLTSVLGWMFFVHWRMKAYIYNLVYTTHFFVPSCLNNCIIVICKICLVLMKAHIILGEYNHPRMYLSCLPATSQILFTIIVCYIDLRH